MEAMTRMALKQRITTIAGSRSQAVSVHQWVCGLDADSPREWFSAAEQDVIENGVVFVMQGGAEAYKGWLSKLWPSRAALAITKATGGDGWWWAALDRATGLLLLEQGEIGSVRFGAADVPVPAPVGLDYQDLFSGHMRGSGLVKVGPRRGEERASGGRKPVV